MTLGPSRNPFWYRSRLTYDDLLKRTKLNVVIPSGTGLGLLTYRELKTMTDFRRNPFWYRSRLTLAFTAIKKSSLVVIPSGTGLGLLESRLPDTLQITVVIPSGTGLGLLKVD